MSNFCLRFTGDVDDESFVTITDDTTLNFGTNDFSLSFWINHAETSILVDRFIFSKSTETLFFSVSLVTGLKLRVHMNDGTGVWDATVDDAVPSAWTHVVIVKTTDYDIYFNGVLKAKTFAPAQSGDPNVDATTDAIFGGFTGYLDDIRFYGDALTSGEIEAIYNVGLGTKYTAAVAEGGAAVAAWDIDEGTGTTITDEVASLVGTIGNGLAWIADGTPFNSPFAVAYLTGKTLTFTIYQMNGSLRGTADQPMYENPASSGFYLTNPIVALEPQDTVIISDSVAGLLYFGQYDEIQPNTSESLIQLQKVQNVMMT